MNVSYCFSSPGGDVQVDDATLARPFILRPFETHPFITLGDYFAAIRDFILRNSGRHLTHLLHSLGGLQGQPAGVESMIIRYEKYGTLYQIASVEIPACNQRVKLAVSTAIAASAKETLQQEFDLLQKLNCQRKGHYLPKIYYRGTTRIEKKEGSEILFMTLSQWFADYHEWHFSRNEEGSEGIIIWDMVGGYRLASEYEAHEIIRQASMILTIYYDAESYHRISPWHHGAGDFVVKTCNGMVDVKLVTARGYEPIAPLIGGEKIEPSRALLLFLLEITVKMRLDKREGMGEPFWAEAPVLEAVLEGFFRALRIKESEVDACNIKVEHFSRFLKSVNEDEIKALLCLHMDEYRIHDPSDAAVFQTHIDSHAYELYCAIRAL